MPAASPVASRLTVTAELPQMALVPLAGLALSQGTSAGALQVPGAGSSAMLQLSAAVPLLPSVSVWLVVLPATWVPLRPSGPTLILGTSALSMTNGKSCGTPESAAGAHPSMD